MGKPRRPRGGRPDWQPKPPPNAEMPAPLESLPEALADGSDVSVAALSRAGFADSEPVLAPAPEIDLGAPGVDIRDSIAHAVSPPVADREAQAHQDLPAESQAADHTDPETERDAAPVLDLVPAVVPQAAEPSALNRIVFAPDRIDMVEIGSTIARYVQGEGAAALAHFRALSDVRTPADLIRLNVSEAQRAADASLTCWVTVVGKASRILAFR